MENIIEAVAYLETNFFGEQGFCKFKAFFIYLFWRSTCGNRNFCSIWTTIGRVHLFLFTIIAAVIQFGWRPSPSISPPKCSTEEEVAKLNCGSCLKHSKNALVCLKKKIFLPRLRKYFRCLKNFSNNFRLLISISLLFVRSATLYGSETWCLRGNENAILKRTEKSMIRAMCGVKLIEKREWQRAYEIAWLGRNFEQKSR